MTINPTTDDARALGSNLLTKARFGALAVIMDGAPYVSRVAMIWDKTALITLVSTLSTHTNALLANSACSVLIGEPADKGDPLTHPRMTLLCEATETDKAAAKGLWLSRIPKAQLYYDFKDFRMFRLTPSELHLNGGFGKAFRLHPQDLHRP
ncbi:HugZ family protein [Loktanella agnita]|uniref:HugZ family pyridoxamine 5'-phosphate oxidase n=1 Tax=Loktanella agnita TaxID=287097 RepID=UPI0039870BA9